MAEVLWRGARAFLTEVFAHRDRWKLQQINAFRAHEGRGDFTSILPDETVPRWFQQRNSVK